MGAEGLQAVTEPWNINLKDNMLSKPAHGIKMQAFKGETLEPKSLKSEQERIHVAPGNEASNKKGSKKKQKKHRLHYHPASKMQCMETWNIHRTWSGFSYAAVECFHHCPISVD